MNYSAEHPSSAEEASPFGLVVKVVTVAPFHVKTNAEKLLQGETTGGAILKSVAFAASSNKRELLNNGSFGAL